jgi:CBS domain-containing protein
MWHTSYIQPHVFRPRPPQHVTRSAQPVEGAEPVERVRLHLEGSDGGYQPSSESSITVADIMERDIIAVPPSLRLESLAGLFMEKRISGFPVVDSRGELLGLVSQTDLLASMVDAASLPDQGFYNSNYIDFGDSPVALMPGGRVADIMTPFVYFATPETDVREVVQLMLDKEIHRVVVTQNRLLQGMVTNTSLLRVLLQTL